MAIVRVDVVGKPGCHLCDDADVIIDAIASEFPSVQVVRHNILDDARLFDEWHNDIPVVLIDGVQHSSWRIDADEFRTALEAAIA